MAPICEVFVYLNLKSFLLNRRSFIGLKVSRRRIHHEKEFQIMLFTKYGEVSGKSEKQRFECKEYSVIDALIDHISS